MTNVFMILLILSFITANVFLARVPLPQRNVRNVTYHNVRSRISGGRDTAQIAEHNAPL